MIIIIDEASAKLASFYYHGDSFKLQWKRAVEITSASQELYDELQEKLSDELHDEFQEKLQEKLPDELREKCMLRYRLMNQLMTSKKQRYKNLQITP